MRTLVNGEEQDEMPHKEDEMPHKAAFHQSTLFPKTTMIVRERNTNLFEIKACDPSIYTMDHPKFMYYTAYTYSR